ncbi:CGNR zinc finger domain-containing protein [Amycolatopsis sp. NBC_01480]|uniref:CGNR zinc finger domain-containing protein n=1 Tax=Amycolatopsis sp. NBC_01480 TaxID=2903562 RepID=UPI003FA434E8
MHTDASLVVAFLNTVDVERNEDLLDDPELWHRWSAEHAGHAIAPDKPADARTTPATLRAAPADARAMRDPAPVTPARTVPADARATPEAARAVRDALRAAIGDPRLPPRPLDVPLHLALTADGPALLAPDVITAVLAAATRLAIRGDWVRLKICPADDCLWAFYDESRNRSRTWCSMRVCGNREKARSWRARTAGVHNSSPVDN